MLVVGPLAYERGTATVLYRGERLQIDRRSFAVLIALLEAGGRPVSKYRLLETAWPGQIVHENSLAKAISRLRAALGEDGALIRSIYGEGYCLLPPDPVAAPLAATRGDAGRLASAPAFQARLIHWLAFLSGSVRALLR
ncbi:hypothetical protein AEB_P2940 [Altererythrobacter sp. B11]|uniref:winged helix-turn-helix domain-containing protein n=1 Tax=Altererythrobacter sp. B11 TaxID=2060312 RepID=UPI000DC6D6E2|nr:winged helix-turn-helix domain-containing protein [Altererythrobacter sp. B11]BBC73808.1 hypothetical protein AEB_P2940 [Altererythrobacter sp. B11]